jgi:hypothetical protein
VIVSLLNSIALWNFGGWVRVFGTSE